MSWLLYKNMYKLSVYEWYIYKDMARELFADAKERHEETLLHILVYYMYTTH